LDKYRVRQRFSSERRCDPLCRTVCSVASAARYLGICAARSDQSHLVASGVPHRDRHALVRASATRRRFHRADPQSSLAGWRSHLQRERGITATARRRRRARFNLTQVTQCSRHKKTALHRGRAEVARDSSTTPTLGLGVRARGLAHTGIPDSIIETRSHLPLKCA